VVSRLSADEFGQVNRYNSAFRDYVNGVCVILLAARPGVLPQLAWTIHYEALQARNNAHYICAAPFSTYFSTHQLSTVYP
jgi:hypothetical protein